MAWHHMRRRIAINFTAALILVGMWWLLALTSPLDYLPDPARVLWSCVGIIRSGEFFTQLYRTLVRIMAGFALSTVISIVLGLGIGWKRVLDELLQLPIVVGLSIPALAWGMLSIMWFGLRDTAAVFAITVLVTPLVTVNIVQGVRSIDKSLIEMAQAFRAGHWLTMREVVLPQLLPYLLGGARLGLSLAWKTVVIVEMLGLSDGIGYMISFWFSMFSMTNVLAWTLLFTGVMVVIEYGILGPLERRITRWRPRAAF